MRERGPRGAVLAMEPAREPEAPRTVRQDGTASAVSPLAVSRLVVTEADLMAGLRADVPQLVALRPLEGGRFRLGLVPLDRPRQPAGT